MARFQGLARSSAMLLLVLGAASIGAADLRLERTPTADSAAVIVNGHSTMLRTGEVAAPWTLVQVVPASPQEPGFVVLEDYTRLDGHLLLVDAHGVQADLAKTAEPTTADPATLFLGHSGQEVLDSPTDLLGAQLLAQPGDPSYEQVASVFVPLRRMPTYSFLGTPDSFDKVGFAYGGRSPNFDPAPYYAPIAQIRERGGVLDGLLGGDLPVLRFVYPEANGDWTEMLAFAPFRVVNGNQRVQPVWYRMSHVAQGRLQWTRYVDSYHPFPPRTDYDPRLYYRDLRALRQGWQQRLAPAMRIDLPDQRLADMARFDLVRDLMTRVGDYPKYGAVDKDYAGSEHDGFPDTFNVEATALLDWGLIAQAGRYLDNFFGRFVRDDGSLLYRGPETGQYGRMLTVVAHYLDLGGDPAVVLRQRARIDGVTRLLLLLRERARRLPPDDPAYGMISGWSEADASLDAHPERYMQPYFSNSTEAARGWRDLGRAWQRLGRARHDAALVAWGARLEREARALRTDLDTALARSMLQVDGERILPSIAGVREPFHVVVPRDAADPQYRSYRAYSEMMYSGSLSAEQTRLIMAYRSSHHDMLLGMPTAYGYRTADLAGFLAYGQGYGLIQHDEVREALLLLYGMMAHQHTRGTWTAPETRNVITEDSAAPYCGPAQLVVPMMTRWMLVFEDPESETLWLGKALPRTWLADGQHLAVSGAPTRWGRVGYSIRSQLAVGTITAQVTLPPRFPAGVRLRLRVPDGSRLAAVEIDGKSWQGFDAATETVTLPAGRSGSIAVLARFRPAPALTRP